MQAQNTKSKLVLGQANLFTGSNNLRTTSLIYDAVLWDTGREQKVKTTAPVLTEFPGLSGTYSTILIDPPWRFLNRTGKAAPEHRRLHPYETMSFEEIGNLPVDRHTKIKAPPYISSPNALLLKALPI